MTALIARSGSWSVCRFFPIAWHRNFGLDSIQVIFCIYLICPIVQDKSPNEIIQAAMKAHGGQEKLAKTLTGSLTAKATARIGEIESTVNWQETFQLPQRYHRRIKGVYMGKEFTMEYAVTDGNGWTRHDNGPAKEIKTEKLPLKSTWNAFLATLPDFLKEGVKLTILEKENVNGKQAVAIKVSGDGEDRVVCFETESGLLVKSKGRIDHPLVGKDAQAETVFSDFKKSSGIQFPHRITSYVSGKKVLEMQIEQLEFLDKVDRRLFEKP